MLAATVPYALYWKEEILNPRRRFEVLSTIYDDIKEDFAGRQLLKQYKALIYKVTLST